MYELWLAMNILFELALIYLPFVAGGALLLAILLAAALAKGLPLWRGWRAALALGVAVTVGATLLVPGMTKSSLAQLGYWVDWANLIAVAAGFGAVAAALALPALALARSKQAPAGGHAAGRPATAVR